MNSAGNDIVALHKIDPGRSQFPGFYTKILAASEVALFSAQTLSFEHFLWLLWSIKESVYKYVKQTTPGLVFSPTRIVVEDFAASPGTSRVYTGSGIFHAKSFITGDCIFTMANDTDDFSSVQWGLHSIERADHELQSRAVRTCLIQRLDTLFPGATWAVSKSPEGHPVLLKDNRPSGIPVSFAHHGHFVGYSFYLEAHSFGDCR